MIRSKERDSGEKQNLKNTNSAEIIGADSVNPDQAALTNPLIDTLFAEKYQIIKVLGEGGMSVVYLARHEAMNKLVAIKTLHTHLTSKTTSLLRFKQEALAASRLQHPGIVAVYDYGITEDGTPYLVMDYLTGESLGDLLCRIGSLNNADGLEIFKQTTAAISHAHERGVVHRDIKPSNIMLSFDQHNHVSVKIVDFGVAKLVEGDHTKLTQTGESIGSPLYMSPEQCLGQPLDVRSDIYSFGCVMYEAILGVPAVNAEGVFHTMMKHIHDMPPSFKDVRPDLKVVPALERIVFKAIAKEPSKRYQSMNELSKDLDNLHENQGIVQKTLHAFELTSLRKTTRHLNLLALTSLLMGAMIIIAVQFLLGVSSTVSAAPKLLLEPVIWSRYQDSVNAKRQPPKNITDGQLANSLANRLIEQDQDKEPSKLDPNMFNLKQLELAQEWLSKGEPDRRQRRFDSAKNHFDKTIEFLSTAAGQIPDSHRAIALKTSLQAYVGRGDCEYFKERPEYAAAARDYGRAFEVMRQLRGKNIWIEMQASEQKQMLLRNADSHYMQGNYEDSRHARTLEDQVLRYKDRVEIEDPNYKALTDSKIAEECFRTRRWKDALDLYEIALNDWTKGGDDFVVERLMVEGRLAEIRDELKDALNLDHGKDVYSAFGELAMEISTKNPEKLKSQFFSDVYQSYAHYLWQRGEFAKAWQMHNLSINSMPRA